MEAEKLNEIPSISKEYEAPMSKETLTDDNIRANKSVEITTPQDPSMEKVSHHTKKHLLSSKKHYIKNNHNQLSL